MKKTPASPNQRPRDKVSHSGMMGDSTEEQNLNGHGNSAARIKKMEIDAAFKKATPPKRF